MRTIARIEKKKPMEKYEVDIHFFCFFVYIIHWKTLTTTTAKRLKKAIFKHL